MRLVDRDSAADYLRDTARLGKDETVRITELPGGVSNVVLLVERTADRPNFVLKQAREKLRVAEPWFCSVERIWREVKILQICEQVLQTDATLETEQHAAATMRATTPRLLFTDEQNFLFAMSAAPPHQVWKQHLLNGQADPRIASACGDLLGKLHTGTWQNIGVAEAVGDRTFFEDLRIAPYYRHVATVQPDLQPQLDRLIGSVDENCLALVHGDFSPKNLLVYDSQLMLVDFEVGHYGDPAFDLGFFLSHLMLKSVWAATKQPGSEAKFWRLTEEFWDAYQKRMIRLETVQYSALVERTIQHFAGCALARVDGKSPVDYLQPNSQAIVRRIATELLTSKAETWSQVLSLTAEQIASPSPSRKAPQP